MIVFPFSGKILLDFLADFADHGSMGFENSRLCRCGETMFKRFQGVIQVKLIKLPHAPAEGDFKL